MMMTKVLQHQSLQLTAPKVCNGCLNDCFIFQPNCAPPFVLQAKCGSGFWPEEILILAHLYMAVSEDSVTSTNQNAATAAFWYHT